MTLAFLLRVRQYAAFGLHPNITQLLEKSGFFSFQICCLIIPGHMLINILVLIINFYMKISNDRYRYYHLDSKNIGKIKFLKRTMKSYQKIQTSKSISYYPIFFKIQCTQRISSVFVPLNHIENVQLNLENVRFCQMQR